MIKRMKELIKNIKLLVHLDKAGEVELSYQNLEKERNAVRYSFQNIEHKINAILKTEKDGSVFAVYLELDIENHPFWENDNLNKNAPIILELALKERPKAMLAHYLFNDWWTRPAFLKSPDEIPDRTQSLLLQYEEAVWYMLPMAGDFFKTFITVGKENTLRLEMTAYTGGIREVKDISFYLSKAESPYAAIENACGIAGKNKKIPLKKERKYPDMFRYLGWCSWDAFYTDIKEELVAKKAEELADKNVPVRWILMDDGWLSIKEKELYELTPDKEKFPGGLKKLTDYIRNITEAEWIGVWHTIAGYWGGIHKDSPLAGKLEGCFYTTRTGKRIPHFDMVKSQHFWDLWYQYLSSQGINFVKVDGQSALKNYYENNEEIGKIAKGTHEVLDTMAEKYFEGRIINCMGMAAENMWNRPKSAVARNSDDFVPDNKITFNEHLLQNAYNSIYHGQLYYCDWDMFWTDHKEADKHALLRAISGGPVYFSDPIGKTVRERLMPLVYHDGEILQLPDQAMPVEQELFLDPYESGIIKLANRDRKTGYLALFAVKEGSREKACISPGMIKGLENGRFLIYDYYEKTFIFAEYNDIISIEFSNYKLFIIIPCGLNITALGRTDKYISTHAVKEIREQENVSRVTLKESGEFSFIAEKELERIYIDEVSYEGDISKKDSLYTINMKQLQKDVKIRIEF